MMMDQQLVTMFEQQSQQVSQIHNGTNVNNNSSSNYLLASLAESSSSSSSSSNLILSVLASTHPSSPGPSPSEGVMASLAMMASSSCSGSISSSTPIPPPPPRHGLSIKSFASREEYLQAMLEDISYWVSELVFLATDDQIVPPSTPLNNTSLICTADNFFNVIETGEILCELANRICECIVRDSLSPIPSTFSSFQPLTFRRRVKPESFFARDNVSTFLNWVSSTWHIHECLMFETDDLVLRKSEKNVILCLLEVARKAYASGLKVAPMLVHMEAEIDKELLSSNTNIQQASNSANSANNRLQASSGPASSAPTCFQQISFNNLVNLDELVRNQLNRCSCPVQFPMIKVADGKYRIGNSNVLIFVRVLRSHVMVRVGGGWDTLEAYLNRHDPCRCQNGGHSAPSTGSRFNNTVMDGSAYYFYQQQSQQNSSQQQTNAQSMTNSVDFVIASSLVDANALQTDQEPQQTSSFINTNTNNNTANNGNNTANQCQASSKPPSLMPPTPPLSFGDSNSNSGGESSPALAPSPNITAQRHRSVSRQRTPPSTSSGDENGVLIQPAVHQAPQQAITRHLTEAVAIVGATTVNKKQANSRRQKSAPVTTPNMSLSTPQESSSARRRKKNTPIVSQSLTTPSSRVRSAPTSKGGLNNHNNSNVIMISRTSTGKHFIASNSNLVGSTTAVNDVGDRSIPKRQSMSPVMKDDIETYHHNNRQNNNKTSGSSHHQQTPLSLSHILVNKSRLVARPRKDPLAGVTSSPSKIPLPVSLTANLLATANLITAPSSVAQLSPSSSSSSQQSPNCQRTTKPQQKIDDDQFTCVRATLVMTICEEDEDDNALLSASLNDGKIISTRQNDLPQTIVDAALIRSRRDTGLGSSSFSSASFAEEHQQTAVPAPTSLMINTPSEQDANGQGVDDDLLLNDFIAMEKLVENEMLLATVTN